MILSAIWNKQIQVNAQEPIEQVQFVVLEKCRSASLFQIA